MQDAINIAKKVYPKIMEPILLNDFTSTSNLKDCEEIDASGNCKFLDDCRNYLNEGRLSPESDFDNELKKCYKILDLESTMELESNSKSDECNMKGCIPKGDCLVSESDLICNLSSVVNKMDNQNEMLTKSPENIDDFLVILDDSSLSSEINFEVLPLEIDNLSQTKTEIESQLVHEDKTGCDLEGSKLECSDLLCHNLNTRSSFLNLTGQQLLHLNNSFNSLNKNSNLVKENCGIIESSFLSSDKINLPESEILSSTSESQIFNADNACQMIFNVYDAEIKTGNLSDILDSNKIISNSLDSEEMELESEVNVILSDNEMENTTTVKQEVDATQTLDSHIIQDLNLLRRDVENTLFDKNLNLTECKTKKKSPLKIENNTCTVSSPLSSIQLNLKQENLLEDNSNQKTRDIKNICHVNENVNFSNPTYAEIEKYEESDAKKNIASNEQLVINENINNHTRNPKICLSEERIAAEKHQSDKINNPTDLKKFDQDNTIPCKELSKDKITIKQNTDLQSSPNAKKIVAETFQPSRIFKLAMKSINNGKNNSNPLNNNNNVSEPNKKKANSESKKIKTANPEHLKKDETKNNEEIQDVPKKESVHPESNKTDNDHHKILKTDVLKNDKVTKDYLEDEKDDLINPEWDAIKNLTTNEERYQQVRKCWGSQKIPDPNKNLSLHSYRKRHLGSGHPEPKTVTQHKRKASTNLNEKSAKRLCTFFIDKEIDTIEKIKEKEKQAIINEMHDKISFIDQLRYQSELQLSYNEYNNARLHQQFNTRVAVIADEYNKIADTCEYNFRDKICTLNERRNEVLKFYGFYEGLTDVSNVDPTQLTETQFQELDEIEDVYRQLYSYYGNCKA